MPWVRFDDQYPIHRKVAALSDAAYRLHDSAIFWCARNLTDGYVPEGNLDDVCARVRTPARFAAECVDRELWHPSGDTCTSDKCPLSPTSKSPVENPRGWVIHDYFEYQFTKSEVLRDREAAARRQKKWREARNASSNGVSHAVSASAPPRPEGKRGRASPERPRAAAAPRSLADRTVAEALAAAIPKDDPVAAFDPTDIRKGRHAKGTT